MYCKYSGKIREAKWHGYFVNMAEFSSVFLLSINSISSEPPREKTINLHM